MKRLLPWVAIMVCASYGKGAEAEVDLSAPVQPPLFTQVCSFCHGGDARGTERAPTLINPGHFQTLSESDLVGIIGKGKGKMPAFPLPAAQLQVLAHYVQSLNATASSASVAGDPKAGERIFFGSGPVLHLPYGRGQGSSNGPNLSAVGRKLRVAELKQSLTDPSAVITDGYQTVSVELNDGAPVRGFARAQDSHDVVLQTTDGRVRTLLDSEYRTVTPDQQSAMPAFAGSAAEQRDLVAFLSHLEGVGLGPVTQPQAAPTARRRSTPSSIRRKASGQPITATSTATATARSTRSTCKMSESCSCNGPSRSRSPASRRRLSSWTA